MLKQANNAAHQTVNDEPGFQSINRGYNSVFRPNHLSLGLVVPLESYSQAPAQPIHLGFRLGRNHLRAYLKSLEEIGVNHVALNLRFNQKGTEETMKRLAEEILPEFSRPGFTE
jgi:hypothetical protein